MKKKKENVIAEHKEGPFSFCLNEPVVFSERITTMRYTRIVIEVGIYYNSIGSEVRTRSSGETLDPEIFHVPRMEGVYTEMLFKRRRSIDQTCTTTSFVQRIIIVMNNVLVISDLFDNRNNFYLIHVQYCSTFVKEYSVLRKRTATTPLL